jgi:hypothetical protein
MRRSRPFLRSQTWLIPDVPSRPTERWRGMSSPQSNADLGGNGNYNVLRQ